MSTITKAEIATKVSEIESQIEAEKDRARKMFEKILEAGNGSWKTFMGSGLSKEDADETGKAGPFKVIRELKKEKKEIEAKDPDLAREAKKKALLAQLAALEEDSNGKEETDENE